MPIKLKNYGRNQKKRKEYIQQSRLLLVGVDVSKAKPDACTTQWTTGCSSDYKFLLL